MPQIPSSQLQVNQPIEAEAPDATLVIAIDPNQPLAVGAHVFQLEVLDDSNNRSQPAQVRVIVFDDQAPTAVINAPERVRFGAEFTLSGAESRDVGGGRITRYIWTLVRQPQ
jgi:hypothetical protein